MIYVYVYVLYNCSTLLKPVNSSGIYIRDCTNFPVLANASGIKFVRVQSQAAFLDSITKSVHYFSGGNFAIPTSMTSLELVHDAFFLCR